MLFRFRKLSRIIPKKMSLVSVSDKINSLLRFVSTLPTDNNAIINDTKIDDEKIEEISDDFIVDKKQQKFYITTAINYTNGKPHIGHAYEALTTDVIARYHRVFGRDVFFLTGTDEHGQKVADTATKLGKKPKELCDENVVAFQELNKQLNISNDYYIRTTDANHYKLAQQMFNIALNNGDIYLSKYVGWYNVKEETYVTETEAKKTNYIEPITKKPYERHEEESYFFKMSKYKDRLIKHINDNEEFIQPSFQRNHILSRLKNEGLTDLCVSRSTFDWGVPVPCNKKHVMYVWFDALSNYLTGINYFDESDSKNLKRFWPANVHIIGRDIVWFHTVIWPTILMSCNIEIPKTVFCHGFVNDKNGEKMSKSLGNTVDPVKELKKYESDTLRYFICSQAKYGEDMRWNNNDLETRHDAHLTHIYGNLVNRTLKLTDKYCKSIIPDNRPLNIFNLNKLRNEMDNSMKSFNLMESTYIVMDRLRECNDWLAKKEPWKMSDKNKRKQVVRTVLESIYILAHFMEPFTPNASKKLFEYLNSPKSCIIKLKNSNLKPGTKINKHDLLFKQFQSKFDKKQANKGKPIIADLDFKIGLIKEVKIHPKNPKSYVLTIACGEPRDRTIVSGLASFISIDNLVNKKCIIFANIKYTKFQGIKSEGMVLAACANDNSIIEPLNPGDNAIVGERLMWNKINLSDWKCLEQVNIKKKNSFWISDVAPTLKTNNNGEFTWNNELFTLQNGQSIKASLKDAFIH